ncbi:MAG TPA: class I SAM-dependent RNA methyltransferase [Mariniphaga sp.]|nr:class I SAM-dependent RNA methyltransferase [Mariniphaga sp.]
MENFKLAAKTFAGLETVLADEIKAIGGMNVQKGRRIVNYEGDLELVYKSNYLLRTALRILREITVFQFKDIDQFYLRCKEISWLKYMNLNQSFIVNSTVSDSKEFQNSMYASLKVKDAIADYFRQKTGKRPDVDTTNPEIFINVHIRRNVCTLSLDSSGESLHKRGYRASQGKAPLSEVLAAGMILLSGWKGDTDFIDPMCGSGTLPIEAAMIAMNIAPGRFRKFYAFENWQDYRPDLFEKIKSDRQIKPMTRTIFASDISKENILSAQTNARRARVFSNISFQQADMNNLEINSQDATIMINPPYGERLVQDNLSELYTMIGQRLKFHFAGNTAWILTSSKDALKNVGLKPSVKMTLYNGPLECIYASFSLFQGKRINQL